MDQAFADFNLELLKPSFRGSNELLVQWIANITSSLTPSLGSTVVSPTPRFESTILAARRQPSTISRSASTSSPTSMSS